MKSILFDSRSAYLTRLSGWERVTQELGKRVVGTHNGLCVEELRIRNYGHHGLLVSDMLTMPRKSRNFDLVHFPTFPPVKLSNLSRPMLYTLFDLTWWKFPETSSKLGKFYYKPLAQKYLDSEHHVLTPSETSRQEISEYFGINQNRITTIYPGVVNCDCSTESPSRGKPFLLTVGTIEPRKNLPLLIRAFQDSGIANQFDLKVVGRFGWGGKLPEGVIVLSDVDDTELHGLYSDCFAVAQPSLYEGFGLPLIEALAHGKLLICSDIPVFREIVGNFGLFVNPLALDDWVDILRDLVHLQYSPKESKNFAKRYNWDESANELLTLYHTIADH